MDLLKEKTVLIRVGYEQRPFFHGKISSERTTKGTFIHSLFTANSNAFQNLLHRNLFKKEYPSQVGRCSQMVYTPFFNHLFGRKRMRNKEGCEKITQFRCIIVIIWYRKGVDDFYAKPIYLASASDPGLYRVQLVQINWSTLKHRPRGLLSLSYRIHIHALKLNRIVIWFQQWRILHSNTLIGNNMTKKRNGLKLKTVQSFRLANINSKCY